MPNIAPFEAHVAEYDEWFVEHADLYAAELKAIEAVIPAADRSLEVGVGSGKFAVPLGIPLGVEPSEKMALRAQAQGVEVIPGVAEALPFPPASFNLVLMVTTICFVDDISQSFAEAFRVLAPGGYLLVAFVDKDSELGREYEAHRNENAFYRFATFFSTPEVIAALEHVGFHIERIVQTLIPARKTDEIAEGYGQGAFVVIKALKSVTSSSS